MRLQNKCKEEKEALEAELEKQTKKAQREIRRKNLSVTEDDVADVVSGWTKIPVKKLAEGEAARLKKLEADAAQTCRWSGRSCDGCGKSGETWTCRFKRSEEDQSVRSCS